MFTEMYSLCAGKAPKHKSRFKSGLFSLDATAIRLCLWLFLRASFRQPKGGIRMHTLLDHDGHIPSLVAVTDAKAHESRMVRTLELSRGSIVVLDKGHISYPRFRTLGAKGVFFVTRLKRNAVYKLPERRPANRNTGVTSDHIIEVVSGKTSLRLRRIGYRDRESGRHCKFPTSHFRLSSKTIADIYRERWKIEPFFKETKQDLRIKGFVGNPENAVLIQPYTALTVYLLPACQKFLSRLRLSLQQLFQLVQLNLLGAAPLEELLSPRRRKNENTYNFSLLKLTS